MKNLKLKLICLLFSATLLIGCGSGDKYAASDYEGSYYDSSVSTSASSAATEGFYSENVEMPEEAPVVDSQSTVQSNRKIIYTSSLTIETLKYDEDIQSINSLVKGLNGYYESSSQSGNVVDGNRYGNFTARIPVSNYYSFMEAVGEIGSVIYKSENAEDVTSTYVDVKARISSLNKKMTRLEELEEKAETVEDLLEIEDRINECQYQIESFTAQLNTLNNQIDFCTIHITVDEVKNYTPQEEESFLSKVVNAFEVSISMFVTFISDLILGVIYCLPFIIVAIIIILIIVKRHKKKKDKKNKIEVNKENSDGE